MQAAVTRDHTVRTIELKVTDVPDLDVTKSWHQEGTTRMMRPNRVFITVRDGDSTEVTVQGGRVLKSGRASGEISEKKSWSDTGGYVRQHIDKAPEWLRTLCQEAPLGVVTWRGGE